MVITNSSPASTPAPFLSVLGAAAGVLFLKCKSKHVILWLKTLQWFSLVFWIKTKPPTGTIMPCGVSLLPLSPTSFLTTFCLTFCSQTTLALQSFVLLPNTRPLCSLFLSEKALSFILYLVISYWSLILKSKDSSWKKLSSEEVSSPNFLCSIDLSFAHSCNFTYICVIILSFCSPLHPST